ncbi:MAG TPA: hypothetical protein VHC22_04155 [Pirellulales bacterium]|nr:hypothetical protein [Pirellulales bacterium]
MLGWIRSSRRSLLAGVVLCGVAAVGYFGWRYHLARGIDEQETLMRNIARIGGRFSLDSEFPEAANYGPPEWVQSIVGQRYFTHIVSVNLGMRPIDDQMVRNLGRLKHLQSLGIWGTRIGDDSLAGLSRLRELETLDISQTEVTDEGLKQLPRLNSIRVLVVGGTRLTDAGLEPLKQMSRLTLLCIVGNQFSPTARQALESALPDATVVFVPLPSVAEGAPRGPQPFPANPRHQPPAPPVPARKSPPPGQFT